jgi:NAD(P)H-dependent FMN reductase
MSQQEIKMLKIGIIISSTRDSRFADKPAEWIAEQAKQRDDLEIELIDIRDYNLPFFNEAASNLWMPSQDENAQRWQSKIGELDGFVFVVAEYNHSIPAALKNALDQAYVEWNRKPAAYLGYGGVGAARAVEHLRGINSELQMAPIRSAVHIGGGELMKIHPMGANGPMSEIEDILKPSVTAMLDDLTWWGNALKTARQQDQKESAAA